MSVIRYKDNIVGGCFGVYSPCENVYSTEEVQVGTYIDGKPVYRKVFVDIMPTETSPNKHILLTDCDVDTIVSFHAIAKRSASENEGILPIFVTTAGGYNLIYALFISPARAQIQRQYNGPDSIAGTWDGAEVRVFVEYTKTTDLGGTPISVIHYKGDIYSFEETRIGRWVNGKPLYRQVFNYTVTQISSAWQYMLPEIPDLDEVANIYMVTNRTDGVSNVSPAKILSNTPDRLDFGVLYVRSWNMIGLSPGGIYGHFETTFFLNQEVRVVVEYTKLTS